MKDSEAMAYAFMMQVGQDLRTAQVNLLAELYPQACFMSQQSAEKALKALAYYRGDRYVTGHSLIGLVQQIEDTYPEVSTLMRSLMRLNQYYIPTRYPDVLAGTAPLECYDREQAEEAVSFAEEMVNFARNIIPQ